MKNPGSGAEPGEFGDEGGLPDASKGAGHVGGHPIAPRKLRQLLLDRRVGPYFLGKLVSNIGVWIHNIVAAIVMWDLTRSALLVGLVSVFQFTPQILIAPWAGALADMGSYKRQAVAGRAVSASGSLLLAGLFAMDSEALRPSAILVSASVVGLGFAFASPATHALVPSLARPSELGTLIAIDTTPMTLARAIGPAIGALVLGLGGPALAFATAGAFQLAFSAVVAFFRLPRLRREAGSDRSARAGLRYLRTDPVVGLLLLGVVGIGLGVDPVITLTPALADALGEGSALVATMASAFGIGAASAPIVLGVLRRVLTESSVAVTGLLLMASGMLLVAASTVAWLAVGALFLAGTGMMLGITGITTQLQQRLPNHLRGRIMALWSVAFTGSRPLAAMINGSLADFLDVRTALLFTVVVLGSVAFWTRPSQTNAS